ncbi:hypothetical protein PRIPAC_95164 [Pristionchus pacificus]|uniref:Uncharacterized protein n=1 Tax=Pristionchus pacificus TaxID=54126 RepID=A0A2A6CV67_PRIPA|nr:hypothetical protein PRIPAC_95164 [Pristionchus pacificus]|eukprot:PDM81943.1 hypothetical protein PRIPAC_34097 [Pristionchus pacificus]
METCRVSPRIKKTIPTRVMGTVIGREESVIERHGMFNNVLSGSLLLAGSLRCSRLLCNKFDYFLGHHFHLPNDTTLDDFDPLLL